MEYYTGGNLKMIKAKIGGKTFKLYVAETLFQQIRGLMFRDINEDEGMIFPHNGIIYPIHTWFMKYPIDLIYCNSKGEVIEIAKNIKPFKSYHPKVESYYLIEIKHNPSLDVKIGDKIEILD